MGTPSDQAAQIREVPLWVEMELSIRGVRTTESALLKTSGNGQFRLVVRTSEGALYPSTNLFNLFFC